MSIAKVGVVEQQQPYISTTIRGVYLGNEFDFYYTTQGEHLETFPCSGDIEGMCIVKFKQI